MELRGRRGVPFNVSIDEVNDFCRIMAEVAQQVSFAIETELKPHLGDGHD